MGSQKVKILFGFALGSLFWVADSKAAASIQSLEDKVLGTGSAASASSSTDTSDAASDSAEADASSESSKSNYDVELPQLETEKEVLPEKNLKAIEDAVKGPREIPRSHILVVQRKYIQKEGRHEIIPAMVGLQPADSFRRQVQWGFGYVYHLTESFGIEALHANVVTNYNTGLAKTIRDQLVLETDRIEPVLTIGSTLQWTPLRSKAGAYTSLHYFEGFFMGGGGFSKFENQTAPLAMAGIGFRIYLTKFAIFKAELRDYIDFKSGGNDYRFNALAGVGVLLGGAR